MITNLVNVLSIGRRFLLAALIYGGLGVTLSGHLLEPAVTYAEGDSCTSESGCPEGTICCEGGCVEI